MEGINRSCCAAAWDQSGFKLHVPPRLGSELKGPGLLGKMLLCRGAGSSRAGVLSQPSPSKAVLRHSEKPWGALVWELALPVIAKTEEKQVLL